MGSKSNLPITSEKHINDVQFYADTIRIINSYLNNSDELTSFKALDIFVKRKIEIFCSGSSKIITNKIEAFDLGNDKEKGNFHSLDDGLEKEYKKNEVKCDHMEFYLSTDNIEIDSENSKDERLFFIQELRKMILIRLIESEEHMKGILSYLHTNLHLIELSLDGVTPLVDKIRKFCNSNFTIRNDDLIGHALRGNYSEIIELFPDLSMAFSDLIDNPKQNLELWGAKFNIKSDLLKIVSGTFTEFNNNFDALIYKLFHCIPVSDRCYSVSILERDFQPIYNLPGGYANDWLKLICRIIDSESHDIKDYQACFEKIFFQIYGFGKLVRLEFLAFSNKLDFYFNEICNEKELSSSTIQYLMAFAKKNKLDTTVVINRFTEELLMDREYDSLCRLIIDNNISIENYEKSFITYFIINFEDFVGPKIYELNNKFLSFVIDMHNIDNLSEEKLYSLFESVNFDMFIYEISASVAKRKDLSEDFSYALLAEIRKYEKRTGDSLKSYKREILENTPQ